MPNVLITGANRGLGLEFARQYGEANWRLMACCRQVALHPGWVRTDMGGPNAPTRPQESIQGLRRVLEGLTTADAGKFLAYDGSEVPW